MMANQIEGTMEHENFTEIVHWRMGVGLSREILARLSKGVCNLKRWKQYPLMAFHD